MTKMFGKYSEEMVEKQKYYVRKVTDKLRSLGKVEHKVVDMFNMLEMLRDISRIMVNSLYVA